MYLLIIIPVILALFIRYYITHRSVDATYYLNKSKKLLKKGKVSDAIHALESSVSLDSLQYEAYKLLADTYYQIKSFEKALINYNHALSVTEEPIAYFNRGITYVSLGELEKAIDDVTHVLQIYDGNKDFIYKELGYLYQMIGDQLQSKTYYDMIMKTPA
ncbi:MAG: hypothetical protein JEZ08_18070 [Clostridiales bacterium]|nr:hypothetical protein [Clostridiales bacterium]